ncbi:MAG: hypothetical protein J7642_17720 [Cyanobacteria bacterium SBC]|nr:hypothetical protein [Cyanobacteria bacterium SBC]
MGRKAKLKKLRRDEKLKPEIPTPLPTFDETQFVTNLERQGYSLKQGDRAPEIPQSGAEPQV